MYVIKVQSVYYVTCKVMSDNDNNSWPLLLTNLMCVDDWSPNASLSKPNKT